VLAVTDNDVQITPNSTGRPRRVSRQEIEQAARLFPRAGRLTAHDVRAGRASLNNPSYVAAILNAVQP
jgi:hypothetical protein